MMPGADETLDDLTIGGYKVLQKKAGYRFSMDAVLLAYFAQAGPEDRLLDLGCGCGVVSLLIAGRAQGIRITALELQESLADLTRRNIALNGLDDRITLIRQDLRKAEVFYTGNEPFTLVTANPPFYRRGEGKVSQDSESEIARHEVCADLADYIQCAARNLGPNGRLAMIHRAARIQEIMALSMQQGLIVARICFVHPRNGEKASLVLTESVKKNRKQGNWTALVEPPIIVYNPDGSYTEQIRQIYFGSGE